MNVIGVVGEYNPFHNGHMLHFEESRELVGEDSAIITVMSGNFVQRGENAVFRKQARAEAAVKCGADLVIELPVPWALSSAEGFARGAVGLLGSLGVVTHLSFGSESGDISLIQKTAEALMDHTVDRKIKDLVKAQPDISYAAARQKVLETESEELSKILEKPNNILAVEYIKAIMDQRLKIEPVTTLRSGPGHDSVAGFGGLRSASELRDMLSAGQRIEKCVPDAAYEVFQKEILQCRGPVTRDDLETAVLSRLRMLKKDSFAALQDNSGGAGDRLYTAVRTEPTLNMVLASAKTKRYAMSRLRRMAMSAALGLSAEDAVDTPPYARVLAIGPQGRTLLREMRQHSRIPIITKPADVKNLDDRCNFIFNKESDADDLYVLGFPAKNERRGGSIWRSSPYLWNN